MKNITINQAKLLLFILLAACLGCQKEPISLKSVSQIPEPTAKYEQDVIVQDASGSRSTVLLRISSNDKEFLNQFISINDFVLETVEKNEELEFDDELKNSSEINSLSNYIEDDLLIDLEPKISIEVIANNMEINVGYYFIDNQSLSNDIAKGMIYLRQIKSKNKRREFADSVSQYYTIKNYLRPDFFQTLDDQRIFGFGMNEIKANCINVYIISNPNCPSCSNVFNDFVSLIEKYNKKVNFKFTYLDSYYPNGAMAFTAANRQGKFAELYRLIHDHNRVNLDSVDIIYKLAKEVGIKMMDFERDLINMADLDKLLKTRDFLFENRIFETPVFIVNNLVLKEPHAINYLENVILEEIRKY